MSINFPNPEEIFAKWLEVAEDKLLSKRYKSYASKSLSISIPETIKESELTVFALLQIEERPAEMDSYEPKATVPMKDLKKYDPFWEFDDQIERNDWKGKMFVRHWSSIKPHNCVNCGGKGYVACECSGGYMSCRDCKGKLTVPCTNCAGKGSFKEKIDIKHGITGKIRQEEIGFKCSICYGTNTLRCPSCHGSNKIPHSTCGGTGQIQCKDCKGTGQVVDIMEEPVPIRRTVYDTYVTEYDKSAYHDKIGEALKGVKHKLPRFEIQDEAHIHIKYLEDFLPAITKSAEKVISKVLKSIDDLNKSKIENWYPPILIFPGLKVTCQTNKGYKFDIICVGDSKNYNVVSIGCND